MKWKSSASDKAEPQTASQIKRDFFFQYNFFSSSHFLLLLPPLPFAQRFGRLRRLAAPPFLLHLISSRPTERKTFRKKKKKKGFHYKISRSASNDDGEINFLHHPPGARNKKTTKSHTPRILLPAKTIIIYQRNGLPIFHPTLF